MWAHFVGLAKRRVKCSLSRRYLDHDGLEFLNVADVNGVLFMQVRLAVQM